jgi:hypothetical protein
MVIFAAKEGRKGPMLPELDGFRCASVISWRADAANFDEVSKFDSDRTH